MIVFDSSALIAYYKNEPGSDVVAGHLTAAVMSSVNLQEVVRFLLVEMISVPVIHQMVDSLPLSIRPHTAGDAFMAAELVHATRRFGSGLGDRSCMALAIRLGVPALTADRAWAQLAIPGLQVVLAR